MEHIGEHFTVLLRIRRHTQKAFRTSREGTTCARNRGHKRAATHVNTHTHTLSPLSHRNTYKTKRGVWDKKKVKPYRTTQGKGPETMRSGWQMARAEWMAEGKGIRQADGTVQQMATEGTRWQQHM